MKQDEIRRLVQKVKRLPTIPVILESILKLLKDEDASADNLAEIISRDQAIASKVLSIANSAYYSLSQSVTSISHAISLLGFTAVKNIAIGTSAFSYLSYKGSGIDLKDLWLHSIGTAMASEKIGKKVPSVNPETAFIGGLLHDIGKLILINIFQEQYKEVVDMAREKSCSIAFAEDKVFGITHIGAGEWLCERWHLPEEVLLSVRHHKTPWVSDGNMELPSIVYLANNIVKRERIGFGGDWFTPKIDDRVFKILNLKEADISEVSSFMTMEKRNIANVLTIWE
ncbi:MAG: HDOD domain-containing protein [Nitrospinae bacterium]|nr:HDOD domain-containing protein [Nitrospinota bacterium]